MGEREGSVSCLGQTLLVLYTLYFMLFVTYFREVILGKFNFSFQFFIPRFRILGPYSAVPRFGIWGHIPPFGHSTVFRVTTNICEQCTYGWEGGGVGDCNPLPLHGLLRGKQKQAKTLYLVRCGQVATPHATPPPPLPN